MLKSNRPSCSSWPCRLGMLALAAAALAAVPACKKSSPAAGAEAAVLPTAPGTGTTPPTDAGEPATPPADAAPTAADATAPAPVDAGPVNPALVAEELSKRPCWNGKAWIERPSTPAPRDPPSCGLVGRQPLVQAPFELLGGRVTLRAPDGSFLQPRDPGIMGAPEAEERESRVFYQYGSEKFVIMVRELFRSGGERFEAGVKKMVEEGEASDEMTWCVEPVATAQPNLKVVALVPSKVAGEGEAVPVLSALVAHPDGLVQLLRFYVNPELAPDGPGCIDLARRIAATIGTGGQPLDRSAGARRLDAWGQTQELQIELPADFLLTPQPGPDFVVYRIEPIVPLDGAGGSIGIYLGDNPQPPPGDWSGPVERLKAPLLGEQVEWVSWVVPAANGEREQHHIEAIRELEGFPGFPRFMHAFVNADDAAMLVSLKDVVKTLQVVDQENR